MGRTIVSIAAVVLALSMLSACTSRSSGPQVSPSPSTTTPTASISPGPGTVTVVLSGIQGEQGTHLAGVLFRGDGTDWNAVGGFSVLIDSDPFSTTQVVHRGYRGWPDPSLGLAFPYVVDEVATVEPGTYTLDLWLARKLGPYGRWLPAASPGSEGVPDRGRRPPGAWHGRWVDRPGPARPTLAWHELPHGEPIPKLLIDADESRITRAVVVGMLREAGR